MRPSDPVARVLAKVVNDPSGCWIFTGRLNSSGYSQVMCRNPYRQLRGHRAVYERMVGPIPDGLHLHHLCHTRACVNPEHLVPMTQSEHSRLHRPLSDVCPRCGSDDWRDRKDRPTRACRVCERANRPAPTTNKRKGVRNSARSRGEAIIYHGRLSGYTNGCRCADCCDAQKAYGREYRRKQKAAQS